MADVDQDALVLELTRSVVAQAAPEELPVLQATARAYFNQPGGGRRRAGPRDEMLGFGVDAMTMLTPTALAAATPVVRFLVDEVTKQVKDQGAGAIHDIVRRLFRSGRLDAGHDAHTGISLSRDQLAEVRRLAAQKAADMNLPKAQADLLADSMVGSLVLADE